jgi:hypothetical protein
MATIPSHHDVGDEGHTTDHNLISDALTEHQQRLGNVEGVQSAYMVKAGGNVINLTNPSGAAESVVIPAGSRDSAVYVKQVTYGGKRTFALDTYGQARLGSATPSEVALTVWGYDATQSGDLQRWRTYEGGPIVSRIGPDGTVYAPNLTPSVWTTLPLTSGLVWNTSLGARPSYRIIGDQVQVRGNVKKSNGSDFTVTPQDIGTLPVGFRPPNLVYTVTGSTFRDDYGYTRMEVLTSGVIRGIFWSSTYNPEWMSLDGITFSITP